MQVEQELAQFSPEKEMLLTIGVFDGVHLGHRFLISRLVAEAKQHNLLSGVVTFKEHPRKLIAPHMFLPHLSTLAERERLLKQEGVAVVIALSFTPELAALSATDFVKLLQKHLKMKGLVIGADFALGAKRQGDAAFLKALGEKTGFTVTVVPHKKVSNETVSSTAIRQAMADGEMEKVTRLLGHPFSLQGKVVPGDHRGAGLGFPTANFNLDADQALPPDGVYATWAHVIGHRYQAMTNIGKRPTFGKNERNIETLILDYDKDLYGKDLRIELIARLRDEKKFNTPEELKRQIADDVKRGSEILAARSRN
ncbi:MAG: bifunctional riboflavin kinase/FAD synthetase [Dehalococcoidales bacterium]|nr:bifunctional riboflavin kinase/FAD synthetase [Dehalococcoidales bacterium]